MEEPLFCHSRPKVELNAAVSLAATTGGLFFFADEGQDEGAAVRRGAVIEQEDALSSAELRYITGACHRA